MTTPRRQLRRQAVGSATLMAILALTAVLTGLGRTASVKPDLLLTAGTNFTVTSSISSSPSTEVPAMLFPGAVRYLSYTVHNPLTVPITVDSLSTSLDPEFQIPPMCPAANLDLSGTGFTGALTVPASGVAQVSRPISLLNTNTNQDGCKSVTFHFVHAGTATYTQVFATTTTLTSAPNPSLLSQSVTFTATVTPAGTPPSGPTGTVNFELCPTTACSTPTSMGSAGVQANGQATFSTSTLTAGTYIVRAAYLGDGPTANFSGSTSNTVSQTVNKFGTTTALTSSLNPSTYGQAVTFTGTVTSPSGTPAGQVNFFDGLTPIGSSTLIGGQATLTTSSLIVGSHPITAVYAGSATHLSSTSPVVSQTVSYTSCVSTTIGGGLTVNAGQWVCITSSGRVNGDVIVKSGGILAVLGGTVNGKLSVQAGGGLTVSGGTITSIASSGAKTLRICGANVKGDLTASGTTTYLVIGHIGNDASPACAKNDVTGNLNVTSNQAGFEVSGNAISKSVTVTGNSGTGEIKANSIKGSLSCSGNVPAPVNGGLPNTVKGSRSGQCSGANF
jgi:hypothetical protein